MPKYTLSRDAFYPITLLLHEASVNHEPTSFSHLFFRAYSGNCLANGVFKSRQPLYVVREFGSMSPIVLLTPYGH